MTNKAKFEISILFARLILLLALACVLFIEIYIGRSCMLVIESGWDEVKVIILLFIPLLVVFVAGAFIHNLYVKHLQEKYPKEER